MAITLNPSSNEVLISLIEEAIDHDTETVEPERVWTRSKEVSNARDESVKIDHQIDGF